MSKLLSITLILATSDVLRAQARPSSIELAPSVPYATAVVGTTFEAALGDSHPLV